MQPTNAVLPHAGFVAEKLLSPQQAIVAFLARVTPPLPEIELVSFDAAYGRILARRIDADDDYPNAPRSAMDGFAIPAAQTPGRFAIVESVGMGDARTVAISAGQAARIPTGGVVPEGTDAVVPFEDAVVEDAVVRVDGRIEPGVNVIERGADMRRGEPVLLPGRRVGAPQVGLLASLGVVEVPVYRRPQIAVLSSGDELVPPSARPGRGEVRDSNRYAIAASLLGMGAQPRHYPVLRDEIDDFAATLGTALAQCDAVVATGGSSVGERDRLPAAVAALDPGIVVHGLRVKPGKPLLLGAHGAKPIVGLPGNPTSALMMLEAVASPIVAALTGGTPRSLAVSATLATEARSRLGWTWYVPVALQNDGAAPVAHPLALRSFSVSLTARADGYIVMGEQDEHWPAGAPVTVHRFLGG